MGKALQNGSLWSDATGSPIHAHGGCILFHSGWYYWYGEDRREDFYISCYRSKNLMDWEFRNHILTTRSEMQPCRIRTKLQLTNAAGGKVNLKFGIHIMRGIPRAAAHNHTRIQGSDLTADMVADPSSICRWNPDMYGVRDTEAGQAYYDSIIELYASWGVDFIKCDDICNTDNWIPHSERSYERRHEIEMLARAIEKCERPIVLSLSPGPALIEQAWHYKKYANMWRITDDFWDDWKLLKAMFYRCELWQDHVEAGCYPDCDMLPLGMLGGGFSKGEWYTHFTHDEQRTMMTLWCLFGSPLMVGAELTKLDDWTLSLLTNREILSMLTPDCRPRQVFRDEGRAIWTARNPVLDTQYAALFNLSDEPAVIIIPLKELEMEAGLALELWTNEKQDLTDSRLTAELAPHACAVYKLG
jgi:hypothetical protein